jgi:hypothetical protein
MKGTMLISVLAGVMLGVLLARSGPLSAQATPEASCREAVTVFIDASRISRRSWGAGNMTEEHVKKAAEGWEFADMEIYTENGDLEGFFLSYTRATTCPLTSEK